MEPEKIFNKKDKFLEDREVILNRKVTAAEKKLLDVIIDKFLDDLEVSDGVIKNNNKNITLTQALEKIFDEFDKSINLTIVEGYIDDIVKGQALNERYFGTFVDDKRKFSGIKKEVQASVRRRLGIKEDGSLKRGGYLANFLADNRIKTEVQELATRAITGELSIREAKDELKILVAGDDTVKGQLSNQYRTFINDTYQQVDNLESALYAEAIGLQAAFYAGGTINTTRKFCCQRNANIYTVDEIKSWKDLKFQGKNKNYNPLTDMGGYNCRHRYRYISNKAALRRRSDLVETESGKLVPIDGRKRQKFNQCA